MLIINSKLYYALNFNSKYYNENRATFNSNRFLEIIDKESISIVDECQRLSIDVIARIISKSKFTFLFGDNKQACFKYSTLLKAKDLEKELKKHGFSISSKEIKKTRRYSDAVDKALSFLTSKELNVKDVSIPNDYQIKIFYDEHKFLEYYKNQDGIKKIYVPVNQADCDHILIDSVRFDKAKFNDDSFSIWNDSMNYFGTTYHALSFDIDHCFVFLNKIHVISYEKRQIMYFKDKIINEDLISTELYSNELNVLFTRGKKSLSIYVNDIETYLFLNYRLSKLK